MTARLRLRHIQRSVEIADLLTVRERISPGVEKMVPRTVSSRITPLKQRDAKTDRSLYGDGGTPAGPMNANT
jgi:hypothetical protein